MSEQFSVLMIDPPWPKRKGGRRTVRPQQGRELDYATMSLPAIWRILDDAIFPMAAELVTVFLWCIEEYLLDTEPEMAARGFRRHARLIWDKGNGIAPAFSVRYSHEYLVWWYKPIFQPVASECRGKFTTVFNAPGRQHSRKPDIAYDMVTTMFPLALKLDVFSREKRDGWEQWGNEIEKFCGSGGEVVEVENRMTCPACLNEATCTWCFHCYDHCLCDSDKEFKDAPASQK